jgi:hypothetical protein
MRLSVYTDKRIRQARGTRSQHTSDSVSGTRNRFGGNSFAADKTRLLRKSAFWWTMVRNLARRGLSSIGGRA